MYYEKASFPNSLQYVLHFILATVVSYHETNMIYDRVFLTLARLLMNTFYSEIWNDLFKRIWTSSDQRKARHLVRIIISNDGVGVGSEF